MVCSWIQSTWAEEGRSCLSEERKPPASAWWGLWKGMNWGSLSSEYLCRVLLAEYHKSIESAVQLLSLEAAGPRPPQCSKDRKLLQLPRWSRTGCPLPPPKSAGAQLTVWGTGQDLFLAEQNCGIMPEKFKSVRPFCQVHLFFRSASVLLFELSSL